ncbi:outer membrane protein assembly factor BamB family protein [Saccharopolyspora sp. NPDC003752]
MRRAPGWLVVLCAAVVVGSTASATASEDSGSGRGDWPSWQGDLAGSRFSRAEHRITPDTVGGLKLKWAFAYPKTEAWVKSQPAVVGDDVFFGGPDQQFYAVDARSGKLRWRFDLTSVAPGPVDGVAFNGATGPAVAEGKVFFGDSRGYVYALDQHTGKLIWAVDTEDHPRGWHTGSPLYYQGRIYLGAASAEHGVGPDYPCCTFRGHIDSLDAATGALMWRYHTVPEPKAVGTWPSGATRYEPSGAGVWGSPVIDETTGTLYVGTGQNYSGNGGDFDTLLALDAFDGELRWKQQVTDADSWRDLCNVPDSEGYCPGLKDNTALDFDLGAAPNLFPVQGRMLVGVGQKSGVYHAFDAQTGEVRWRRQLSVPSPLGGATGIQWGSSYDGQNLYVATYFAEPGTLNALDPATGEVVWTTPNPANGCDWGGAAAYPDQCVLAHTPAVTSSPGLVYEGSTDGKMRVYAAGTGEVLWEYDTVRDFVGANGLIGRGGSVSGNGGAVVANGTLYVQAGYYPMYPSDHGNVLLAFDVP